MTAVSPEMHRRIDAELTRIETEEDVRILFAIESGSRAWGFHSPDSDYDVRFVYVRPLAWHLRLEPGRDVIERPLDDELDISGWDLRKALNLMLSGNAVLGEWIRSPIRYRRAEAMDGLETLAASTLRRRPATWHYVNLLQRQMDRVRMADGSVRLKSLLYSVRPALCLRWIARHDRAFPPMDMARLMAEAAPDAATAAAIDDLIALKLTQPEGGRVESFDPLLCQFIDTERTAARAWLARQDEPPSEADDHAACEAFHIAQVTAI
ncbi:nucleotidyltransferase domain-containing protein [Jannaschia pohangensis]|uniref:Nucleotidyltransferase n=1 Tax=Jannaschia pohangensis TaxID=390807 RepID=A0A1I3NV51_9RHOB|nr:nucleotidyltransferase domain-containing protein [Jannaschia pohangensis]SFJ13145.1 hypothetical protein SAMN04488095_2264 [Jannaschia pohangensis]